MNSKQNFSTQIKNRKTDEWYTPEDAVRIIIPFLNRGGYRKILCPFDTSESNFVKVLSEEGFDVSYSHIDTGINFFNIHNLDDYDAVVSNPPYSLKEQILSKLFVSGVPFAMLIGFNGIFDNKRRWAMFKENDFELLIPCGRVKFFNDTFDGKSPQFQSVYVCHRMLPKQIVFEKL